MRVPAPRDITPPEAAVVEWLLEHAAIGDVTAYRTKPASALQVVGGCTCGCASLDFYSATAGPFTMLADAVALYPDQQQAGLLLWGRDGDVVWLEIYEMHAVADRFPTPLELRPWGN